MNIVILLYPSFAATDALGPYEILARLPGARVRFVAAQPGPVTADTGMLTVVAEAAYASIEQADVLVVPGAPMSALPAPSSVQAKAGNPAIRHEWLAGAARSDPQDGTRGSSAGG